MTRLLSLAALIFLLISASSTEADEGAVPEEIRERMSFLVGNWESTGAYKGKDVTGSYSARWNANQNGLILSSSL